MCLIANENEPISWFIKHAATTCSICIPILVSIAHILTLLTLVAEVIIFDRNRNMNFANLNTLSVECLDVFDYFTGLSMNRLADINFKTEPIVYYCHSYG